MRDRDHMVSLRGLRRSHQCRAEQGYSLGLFGLTFQLNLMLCDLGQTLNLSEFRPPSLLEGGWGCFLHHRVALMVQRHTRRKDLSVTWKRADHATSCIIIWVEDKTLSLGKSAPV